MLCQACQIASWKAKVIFPWKHQKQRRTELATSWWHKSNFIPVKSKLPKTSHTGNCKCSHRLPSFWRTFLWCGNSGDFQAGISYEKGVVVSLHGGSTPSPPVMHKWLIFSSLKSINNRSLLFMWLFFRHECNTPQPYLESSFASSFHSDPDNKYLRPAQEELVTTKFPNFGSHS